MEKEISIEQFIKAIKQLPSDKPQKRKNVWYLTQKQHWLGWLGDYGRKTDAKRDAKFAYNHVVCPDLLLYLFRAIPLRPELVEVAEQAYRSGSSLMEKSGAIRKVVPWSEIYQAIWGEERKHSSTAFGERLFRRKKVTFLQGNKIALQRCREAVRLFSALD